jgi:prephenate dehydrogenase
VTAGTSVEQSAGTVAVVGTGLIGTSVALALRDTGRRVLLVARDAGRVALAVDLGAGMVPRW